jgi:hypothetical protein
MLTRRRLIASKVVGMLVLSLGIVAVTSAPASATCSNHVTPTNKDPGYESVTGAGSTGVARRIGPHISCQLLSRIPNGRQMDMWCWDYGETVHGVSTWSWVRYQPGGTAYYGYVSDYYLTNRGADVRC